MKINDKRASAKVAEPDYRLNKSLDDDYSANDLKGANKGYAEQEIINKAIKFANNYFSGESDNIQTYRDDLNFLYADQWTQDLRAARSQKKKTVLTFNYLKTYVDLLLGEEIKNDPDIFVSYFGNQPAKNMQKEIDLRQGLLRQTFYDNKMSMVKQYCFQYMLAGGFSVIEVGYDYENSETFNKRITIEHTDDATNYFFDNRARNPLKDDGRFCGKVLSLTKEEYKMFFPHAQSCDSINLQYQPDDYTYKDWQGEMVKILQWFAREEYEETIYLLSNGESMTKDEAEEFLKEQDSLLRKLREVEKMGAIVPQQFKQKVEVIEDRRSICDRICHYKMNRTEILEWGVWPSKFLPYVYVPNMLVKIDGNLRTLSLHRYAQDAQRYINYLASEAADILMTSHHKNWMAPTQCFDGKLLNLLLSPQNTSPVLLYKKGANGEEPQYVPPPQLSPSFDTQFQRTVNDISNIMGRFESNRGQDGNEKSGIAIDKRAVLGNVSSVVPFQNLALAEEHIANICLDLYPAVFDVKRTVTIRGKDRKEKQVVINEDKQDKKMHDMSLKNFKASIQAGVTFEAQKQVSIAQLQSLISSDPALAALLADELAKNLQVANMPEIVDRIQQFQLGIPIPQIIAKETGMQPPKQQPPPPNPQLLAVQQKQQQAQMDFQTHQAQQEIDKQKLALQAQDMVQDSLRDHTEGIMQVKKLNTEIQKQDMKSRAEIERAKLDNHTDLTKHFNPQPAYKDMHPADSIKSKNRKTEGN